MVPIGKLMQKNISMKTIKQNNMSNVFEGADFCMQFDNDEIHVISATMSESACIEVKVTTTMDGGVTFLCPTTGKKVRLFARPLSDAGRKLLEEPENE